MKEIYKAHDYQEFSTNFIVGRNASGLLLEMGLGKTVATLTAIDLLMHDFFRVGRVLVVAPLRVARDVWTEEMNKWSHLNGLRYSLILGNARQRRAAIAKQADVYIISRDHLVWLIESHGKYNDKKKKTGFVFERRWEYDMVVLDEMSRYKNSNSKGFKLLKKTRPYIKKIVGLTGTPMPNGLMDLWSQIYLLDQGKRLGRTITAYRERFFYPGSYVHNASGNRIVSEWVPKPGAEDMIYSLISDICVSMKAVDHLKMPEKIIKNHIGHFDSKTAAIYKELEKEYILENLNGHVIDAGSAAALSLKLHQLAQGAIYVDKNTKEWQHVHDEKLEMLDELILDSLGKPIMVLYWFKPDLERLKKRYKNARVLDTKKDKDDWNAGKIRILLAQPASIGHGLNIQKGGHIATWFSLPWSLELYEQVNGRLWRQGQQNSYVIINHLIMQGTVDERIMEVLQGKKTKEDALMDAVKAVLPDVQKAPGAVFDGIL